MKKNFKITYLKKSQKFLDKNRVITENEIEDIALEEEILIDEEGRKYKILNLVRELPRRTYILGDLNGKYWGEIDTKKETEFVQNILEEKKKYSWKLMAEKVKSLAKSF